MSYPQISIVVPTYNSADFISDMIFSLEGQSYQNFEVIISDGGSTDSTLELARAASLSNVIIDSRSDSGVPDALNKGFALASGEILSWLNSDDVYTSRDTLAYVAKAWSLSRNNFLFGHMKLIDCDGVVTGRRFSHYPIPAFKTYGNNLFTGSLFLSSRMWAEFSGFSEVYRYSFEYEIIRHLFDAGNGSLINRFLSAFRVHSGGISSRLSEKMLAETEQFFSYRKRRHRYLVKAEQCASLLVQGNLARALSERISPKENGRHWREFF